MADEKKNQTTNKDPKPQGKPFADKELDQVSGGEGVSLNFTQVKVTYKPQ